MCFLDFIEQLFPTVVSLNKKTLFLLSDVCSGVKYFLELNELDYFFWQ